MIFGRDEKGYGITVEVKNKEILIITRKGSGVLSIPLEPKEARKLAKEIYKVTKELENYIKLVKRIEFYDKLEKKKLEEKK